MIEKDDAKKIGIILAGIVAFLTIVGMAVGVDVHYNNRFATNEKVELIATRLDQKIISDRLDRLRDKVREIKIKYGTDPASYPDYIREAYWELLDEIKKEEKKLNGG